MPSTISVQDLAAGWATGLHLSEGGGLERTPLVVVDLASARGLPAAELAAAAHAARAALPVVIGVGEGGPGCEALVGALDLTLGSDPAPVRAVVPVADPESALARLAEAVESSPRASVVLTQVVRQAEQLDVRAGLAVEAAAYSMLLAGPEFAAWLERRGPRRAPARSDSDVTLEREGDLLRLHIDRAERRNAFSVGVRDALVEALTLALAGPELRVELDGRGTNFSSGGDLDEFGLTSDVGLAYLVRLERHPGWLLHRLGSRATVRLHGACIGAGVELPSLAAHVVAAEDARFGLPEVGMGLIPGAGGTVGITKRIGRWRTAWLALTGARLSAVTAHEWGLVDELVPSPLLS